MPTTAVLLHPRVSGQIIRDKKTKKSKGFGIVSLLDGGDFAKVGLAPAQRRRQNMRPTSPPAVHLLFQLVMTSSSVSLGSPEQECALLCLCSNTIYVGARQRSAATPLHVGRLWMSLGLCCCGHCLRCVFCLCRP